ncbi:MAG: ferredoxin thioredoxin reductase catalytic beta chain [Lentisphaeria bacterium]|nr:ferredoxin thioredoxin reductase catalytic beta chain [Lentisphaeria bacterium]
MVKLPEKVRYNDDAAYVEKLLKALEMRGGYCPCRVQRIEDNICICREFREQIADPEFSGLCHCKLFYKEK